MRRVIGGHGVDDATTQGVLQRLDVARRSQRRVHLEDGVVVRTRALVEREVMGCDFEGHRQTLVAGAKHHLDRASRREVQEVQRAARQAHEFDVAHAP